MNAAKRALASSKNFVANHKVAIAIVTTATATAVVMEKSRGGALREVHEFLEERQLENDFLNFVIEKSGLNN